jgi:hypothetical protein
MESTALTSGFCDCAVEIKRQKANIKRQKEETALWPLKSAIEYIFDICLLPFAF